ncbi:MAG: TIR domain-containing protein [Verrucomicrobiaceae bacterium]|nr:TIR domain-containing protein [Verrucomicrobiaceae bacterium]
MPSILATPVNDLAQESLNPLTWEYLLEYIDAGKVVVIVGPELLDVDCGGKKRLVSEIAAEKLAERLEITVTEPESSRSLNDVVCCYLKSGRKRADIYAALQIIFRDLNLQIPESLRKLARMSKIKLFVTTSFDPLLRQAIEEETSSKPEVFAYAPNDPQDLPTDFTKAKAPVVYHLLGRLSATPDYVVTDEDMLEFLCSMQDPTRRPPRLSDELKKQHLLIIGCSYPDWLARFFIRTTKGDRLSSMEDLKVLAANRVREDRSLVAFLEHFSQRTEVVEISPANFVNELWERYQQRQGLTAGSVAGRHDSRANDEDEHQRVGVFLSYATEDVAAAEAIRDALDAAGIDVWFDKHRLESGDLYDAKIRQNIRNCLLFLPVISETTERRAEGYFRLEWDLAAERSRKVAATIPFIVPIVIDDVSTTEALVPPRFLDAQWQKLPSGAVSEEFVLRIVRLVRERQKREKAHA